MHTERPQERERSTRAGSAAAEPVLIFVHIPRTGGTTLRAILSEQYERRLVLDRPAVPEDFAADPQLVQGHLDFGVHELVGRPARYATMLRRPVDRIVSLYHMHLRGLGALVPSTFRDALTAGGDDLCSFATSTAYPELENGQTKRLSGLGAEASECTPEMLEAALRNLRERIDVVGLTERFAESVLLMKREFGWGDVQLGRWRHVSVSRLGEGDGDGVDDDAVAAIMARNRFDQRLYEEAERLFEERVARLGPAFRAEAQALAEASGTDVVARLLDANEEIASLVAKHMTRSNALRAKNAGLRTKLVEARAELVRLGDEIAQLRRENERLRGGTPD